MKDKLLALILVAGSTLFALLLAEAGLRLYGVTASAQNTYWYVFDPDLGWSTKKEFRFYNSTPHWGHFTQYDKDGFPASARAWHARKDPAKRSLALLGDSFPEGYYLPYEDSVQARLERALPDEQIVNLGVAGYCTPQYLLRARRELPRFKDVDKIVLFFFASNDINATDAPETFNYKKPVFGESLDAPLNTPITEDISPEIRSPWTKWLFHHSAAYAVARPFLRRAMFFKEAPAITEHLRFERSAMRRALLFAARVRQENPRARFWVYYVARYEEMEAAEDYAKNLALFEDLGRELGFETLKPEGAFLDPARRRSLYIPGDGHWTALGAEEVAAQLLRVFSAAPRGG